MTLLHAPSQSQDSNEVNLICDAKSIFNPDSLIPIFEDSAPDKLRGTLVDALKQMRKTGMKQIANALSDTPNAARQAVQSYAWLTDELVKCAWRTANQMHPNATPTEAERLSVIAVGGYGRFEMAPFSDLDLLFLTPYKITPWAESVIESMLYMLWDLRLKVGHSSRTIRDCLRLGREDFTIRTAMLEQRYVCGDTRLAQELEEKLWSELFAGSAREFIDAKLGERDARHEKQGQRYMVEPNIKEGKGGLRDLQSLFWITKYVYRVQNTAKLVDLGVFRPEEYALFEAAENFLWAARCHLHLVTNRAAEQLSFDLQVEVADRMGYRDQKGRRGVEVFMQDYFRHATKVGDLTRILLTSLEADHTKDAPLLERIFRRKPKMRKEHMVINGRLAVKDPDTYYADKLNLLRIFEEGLRTGLLIHPNEMRMVSASLGRIDDDMRTNPEAQRIFLDLLLKHGNPERALRRMNELGALSAFIPEFEPIVAMMQFNMYHSYTVDEHTIQVIKSLAQIERAELEEELPIASSILKAGINRKVIYVALLLHDIGKGRSEDHSILGAKIARKVAPRLGLSQEEVDTVEWLVRYHLLMSDMAQKRDIADPRTVRDFAKAVQTTERLDLLTVLTVCDIRGVGPNTWNNWKATLIRALYTETKRALKDGLEAVNRKNRGNEAKGSLKGALKDWKKGEIQEELERHYEPYWQGLPDKTHVVFANLLRHLGADEIRLDVHPDIDRDATRICFALHDHPGIFSRLAGALTLVGANVVDARTYTTKDGYATAAFWVQDSDGEAYDLSRLSRLSNMIERTLKGEVVTRDAVHEKDKFKKREKAFKVLTSVTFDNDGSDIYTIIEVDTRDRPGLLFDLTRTLANLNVYIASAVVATYGEQVVDSFYVKDMFGLKFYSDTKQRTLERQLTEAISKGVERAEG